MVHAMYSRMYHVISGQLDKKVVKKGKKEKRKKGKKGKNVTSIVCEI